MGQNSADCRVLGSRSYVMQRCRFDPPSSRPVEGIFPLELTWLLTPFSQNSFGWEFKPQSSLCTFAFHHTDSKEPDIHVIHRRMLATTTWPACTIPKDGMWPSQWLDLKMGHIHKNLTVSVSGEPQSYSWECRRRSRRRRRRRRRRSTDNMPAGRVWMGGGWMGRSLLFKLINEI